MTSIAFEPRALGPRAVDRTSGGVAGARRDSSRAFDAAVARRGEGRREGGPGFLRAVAGEIVAVPTMLLGAVALYVAVIAPPLLTLMPAVLLGLLMQAIQGLFGWAS